MEPQFDDEEGVFDQKVAQLTGIDQPFVDADQKGFEVGTFRVRRAPTRRTPLLPLLDEGPIEQGEEGTIVSDNRIIGEQLRYGRLVKDVRSGYHSCKLLLFSGMWLVILCKRSLFCVKPGRTFA